MEPAIRALCERVRTAAAAGQALRIRGGGTKDFYGNSPVGELLELQELRGVVAYEPSELVVTARGGTPLAQLEQLLADQQQMLAFEPPHFGAAATVGGCVAAGLAGPRRAANGYARGGVRDFLLGAKLIDGRGQLLAFGGTVMKNVAGFDVARLLAGSLGILGVIAEVSVKVLPMPAAQKTLRFALNEAAALTQLQNWQMLPLPISASCWLDGQLTIRLSGARAAVAAARSNLGGELLDEVGFWTDVREQQLDYFGGNSPLWRISLPATAPALNLTFFGSAGGDEYGYDILLSPSGSIFLAGFTTGQNFPTTNCAIYKTFQGGKTN